MRKFSWRIAATIAGALAASSSVAWAAEVNVYTSREPALVKPVFEAFTAATGTRVNAVFVQNGLEERVKAEGANSPADVIVLVDVARLANAKAMGITQPFDSREIEAAVPTGLRDPDGHWTAVTLRSRVVYAAKDRVKQDAITYEDLADPRWKGRICIRSAQHPYNVSLIGAMIAHHGEEQTADWLTGLKANLARKPSGGDRDVAKDIVAGVCDIGLGNTYYVGLLRADQNAAQQAWGQGVKVLDSRFQGGGTHVNVSGAAIAKNAPNKAQAQKLIAFMLSDEAQRLMADANFEYPVRAGLPSTRTQAAFGPIAADPLALAEIARQRRPASELVDRVGIDN
jgi:iron(III) transport system substrate-binding protein